MDNANSLSSKNIVPFIWITSDKFIPNYTKKPNIEIIVCPETNIEWMWKF